MFSSKQELSKTFSVVSKRQHQHRAHGRGQRPVVAVKAGVYSSSHPSSSSGNSSESSSSQKNTYRRVLRYPDGYERVLIYPADYKGRNSFAQQQIVGSEQPSQRSWDIAGLWNTQQQTQPKVIEKPTLERPNSLEEADSSQGVDQAVSSSLSLSLSCC
jgi:hypothetical protein